jgi:hypothetical protein
MAADGVADMEDTVADMEVDTEVDTEVDGVSIFFEISD